MATKKRTSKTSIECQVTMPERAMAAIPNKSTNTFRAKSRRETSWPRRIADMWLIRTGSFTKKWDPTLNRPWYLNQTSKFSKSLMMIREPIWASKIWTNKVAFLIGLKLVLPPRQWTSIQTFKTTYKTLIWTSIWVVKIARLFHLRLWASTCRRPTQVPRT